MPVLDRKEPCVLLFFLSFFLFLSFLFVSFLFFLPSFLLSFPLFLLSVLVPGFHDPISEKGVAGPSLLFLRCQFLQDLNEAANTVVQSFVVPMLAHTRMTRI